MICSRVVCRGVAVVMAAACVVPVGSAVAVPGPPAPVPEAELVPGVAPKSWVIDTPDQVLAPDVYTPGAREDAVEPREAEPGAYDLVEYVPLGDAVSRVTCSKQTGPYQRQAERWLGLKADGKQSAADCRAVRAFQLKHKIKPAIGFAGPVTWATMQLVGARKNPNAAKKCPVRPYRVACVDLGRQLTWVQKGTKGDRVHVWGHRP
ncbi:peptidoglycan-binding protein [Streptomyces sp. P17]|uniref:peptidoglycan-binding protein n=1 Tax=Streptomyces sp. P17 TaxID=3074716 RepID=UPI0037DDAAB2